MPKLKYRCSWDDIAFMHADHMAGWGAFEPDYRHAVDFDDEQLPVVDFEMEGDSKFRASYRWQKPGEKPTADFVTCRISLERRPCRLGGKRTYFICPCCLRRVSRLAVLPEGLRCGPCGQVTWASRRERPVHRLIRKANKLAQRLECSSWRQTPTQRPKNMHGSTFNRLSAELAILVARINSQIGLRLSARLMQIGLPPSRSP